MKNNFKMVLFLASIALMSCSKEELITNTSETQAQTQVQNQSETQSTPEQQTTSIPYEPFVIGKDGGCGGIPGKKDTLFVPVGPTKYKDTLCGLFEPKRDTVPGPKKAK